MVITLERRKARNRIFFHIKSLYKLRNYKYRMVKVSWCHKNTYLRTLVIIRQRMKIDTQTAAKIMTGSVEKTIRWLTFYSRTYKDPNKVWKQKFSLTYIGWTSFRLYNIEFCLFVISLPLMLEHLSLHKVYLRDLNRRNMMLLPARYWNFSLLQIEKKCFPWNQNNFAKCSGDQTFQINYSISKDVVSLQFFSIFFYFEKVSNYNILKTIAVPWEFTH